MLKRTMIGESQERLSTFFENHTGFHEVYHGPPTGLFRPDRFFTYLKRLGAQTLTINGEILGENSPGAMVMKLLKAWV